jgi:hypothetical protein
MARLKNGIPGGLTGIIGTIDTYMLNGKCIIRSRRQKSNKPIKESQLAPLVKMNTVTNFLHPRFTDVINFGFKQSAKEKEKTADNLASSYQFRNAVTGQYPNYRIDYPNVRFTEGPLSTEGMNAAVAGEKKQLRFTWTPQRSNDRVIMVAYAPKLNEAIYNLSGAKRSIGTDVLDLENDWVNEEGIETYLAFRAEDSFLCTNSIYLGQVRLPR